MDILNKINNFNSPVSDNITKYLKLRGLKQCAVAESAGLTPHALCDCLNGRRILKVLEVDALAKALNVEPNELFRRDTT